MARRATSLLEGSDELVLADLVFAETVFVLESQYGFTRGAVFVSALSLLALPSINAPGYDLLIRALALYRTTRLHFVDAYMVALAEASGVRRVASFDKGFDRIDTIEHVEL
jgi:predicted nucleic acid-binding protein